MTKFKGKIWEWRLGAQTEDSEYVFYYFFMNDGRNTSIWNQISKTSILKALLKLRKYYLKYVLASIKMFGV